MTRDRQRTCYPVALAQRHPVTLPPTAPATLHTYLQTDFEQRGFDADDARVLAEMYVRQSSWFTKESGQPVPSWPPPADYLDSPRGLPVTTHPAFPPEDRAAFGLYPIVADCMELERLLPLGLGMIQLRAKGRSRSDQDALAVDAIRLAHAYPTKLYINDAWEVALRHGAHGVHLGQDDLDQADTVALQRHGLRLGISTHSVAELVRASQYAPSYIAMGTVFPTRSKQLDYAPLGLAGLRFLARLSPVPVVAIGGIHLAQAQAVYAAGAAGIAAISEMQDCPNPAERVRQWARLATSQPAGSN